VNHWHVVCRQPRPSPESISTVPVASPWARPRTAVRRPMVGRAHRAAGVATLEGAFRGPARGAEEPLRDRHAAGADGAERRPAAAATPGASSRRATRATRPARARSRVTARRAPATEGRRAFGGSCGSARVSFLPSVSRVRRYDLEQHQQPRDDVKTTRFQIEAPGERIAPTATGNPGTNNPGQNNTNNPGDQPPNGNSNHQGENQTPNRTSRFGSDSARWVMHGSGWRARRAPPSGTIDRLGRTAGPQTPRRGCRNSPRCPARPCRKGRRHDVCRPP
jgi:hypothetical protein